MEGMSLLVGWVKREWDRHLLLPEMEIQDHFHDRSCSKYYCWNPPGEEAILWEVHWKIQLFICNRGSKSCWDIRQTQSLVSDTSPVCTLLWQQKLCHRNICFNSSTIVFFLTLRIIHEFWKEGYGFIVSSNNKNNKCLLFLNNHKIQTNINKKVRVTYYSKHPEMIVINIWRSRIYFSIQTYKKIYVDMIIYISLHDLLFYLICWGHLCSIFLLYFIAFCFPTGKYLSLPIFCFYKWHTKEHSCTGIFVHLSC